MTALPDDDPFRHHPGLRALVTDPLDSTFRDFDVEAFAQSRPDLDLGSFILPKSVREAARHRVLAERPDPDLWVFAYGSLMWDPGIRFAEVRRARIDGYERKFILKDTFGGRGTHDSPGLMAALDHGVGCDGLAYRIPQALLDEETPHLWARERAGRAYCEAFVPTRLSDMTVTAVTFVADRGAEIIQPDLPRAEQVEYLARGEGFLGSSLDYIENLARHFELLKIDDAEVTSLLAEARAHKAALASGAK